MSSDQAPGGPGRLDRLPHIVIDSVCSFLRLADIKNLRLTCRVLATIAAGPEFHHYVARQRTSLSVSSLQRLQDLSQSPYIVRRAVRHLTVDDKADILWSHEEVFHARWLDYGTTKRFRIAGRYATDEEPWWYRIPSSRDVMEDLVQRLRLILSDLPNLESVAMYIVGPNNYPLQRPLTSEDIPILAYCDQLFEVLFRGIISSSVRLRKLDLLGQTQRSSIRLNLFNNVLSSCTDAAISVAFSRLEVLSISITTSKSDFDEHPGKEPREGTDGCYGGLGRFLSYCHESLRELDIHRFTYTGGHCSEPETTVFTPVARMSFPRLRTCIIRGYIIQKSDLEEFLQPDRVPVLQSLKLWGGTLLSDGATSPWESIFQKLTGPSRIGAPLKKLELWNIRSNTGDKVFFTNATLDPRRINLCGDVLEHQDSLQWRDRGSWPYAEPPTPDTRLEFGPL